MTNRVRGLVIFQYSSMDSQTITYGINHRLTYKENHDGLMKGNTNEEIDQQWSILQKHIGKTESTILVRYSNGETGEQ